jgi:hypothetical protein
MGGVYGCSAVNPDTGLPPQQLGPTAIRPLLTGNAEKQVRQMTIRQINGNGIRVFINALPRQTARLTITNCKGEIMKRLNVPDCARAVSVDCGGRWAPGWYIAEVAWKNGTQRTGFYIMR